MSALLVTAPIVPRFVSVPMCDSVPVVKRVDEAGAIDVVGIGNAIVDVIAREADAFVDKYSLVKGSMTLIDTERAVELYEALNAPVEMSGGSAANTMCGVASFGGNAAYIGKVSADDLGDVFGHDMRAVGVRFVAGRRDNDVPTGRSLIVVTPDAERTMNTYLGAASLFGPDDLDEATLAASSVLYMEGYLYDRPPAKQAFGDAATIAHSHGREVTLSLSDSFCVDRHREDFLNLLSDHIDIVFGNDAELCSLYQTETLEQAIESVRQVCRIAVITKGAGGSVIVTESERVEVPAFGVPHLVDTTGAGDMYAAGFLYGYTQQRPFGECGRLGSLAASEVISHVGPRPLIELRTLVDP